MLQLLLLFVISIKPPEWWHAECPSNARMTIPHTHPSPNELGELTISEHIATKTQQTPAMPSASSDDNAQQPPAVLETDTLILGAGPQALCVASSLLESQPYALDDYAALGARRRVQVRN